MKTEIESALSVLRKGGVILYPTDTIWGLGCDATNSEAVKKIIGIKQRADHKSFIVLVDSVDRLETYIEQVPEIAYQLIEVSDTPLTIIYPCARVATAQSHSSGGFLAPEVVGADGSVGIRVVNHPFCQQLIARLGRPIVSTSANLSEAAPPQGFAAIHPLLRQQADYCVNPSFEDRSTGKPSSIIQLDLSGGVKIIRP